MSSRVSQVMGTGERFEEGENEPILFADVISHNTIDTQKGMLAEKFHKAYYERGLPFPQAIATINNLSYSYIETWKQGMIKEGFAQEEIFYKLPFGSYDAVREDGPLLPATVD